MERHKQKPNLNKEKTEIRNILKKMVEVKDNKEKAILLQEGAENIAEYIGKENKTSKHQIRKYYHKFLDIKEKVEAENAIEPFLPELSMNAAYVTYDKNRNNSPVGELFKTFIKEFVNLALQGDKARFFDLMMLFEAVVGYSTRHVKKK